jgi:hypothetical protein
LNYDSILKDLAQTFYENHGSGLKLSKNKRGFSLNSQYVQGWNFLKAFNVYPPCPTNPATFSVFSSHLCQLIKDNESKHLDPDLKTTTIGIDILKGTKHVIEDGGLQPYDFQTFKESLDPDQFEMLYEKKEYMVVAFNPFRPLSWEEEIETTTGRKPFTHYNTYIRPLWTYEREPKEFPLCEEFVAPFLDLFLPNEDERHYVMYWLYSLSLERRNDILVLIGMQGNGKNTLMQLATLDEYAIRGASKESLKSFSNDDITVEVKGGDPIQVENHCSFIVANNSMRSTDLEFKDRRFTCPKLNNKDLLLHWSKDRIAAFKSAMRTIEFQVELPYWLGKEVRRLKLNYPDRMNYITPHFYNLVEAAKPEWFKEFKRQLKYKQRINAQDIYKATRMRVSDSRIEEELEKEIEERRHRDIKPHTLAVAETEDGKTQYISKLFGVSNETSIS